MYTLKFIIKPDEDKYNGIDSIISLVNYVMDFNKVSHDKLRVNTSDLICSGCSPFPYPVLMENSPEAVMNLMITNNKCYGKGFDDTLRHRVVSFPADQLVLPEDLNLLGRRLIEYYSSNGFIACYGVHRDTYHYHIHVLINTISYVNGYKFNIYREYNHLKAIIDNWNNNYMEVKLSDGKTLEKYQNILFGDDCVPAYKMGIGAKEQIRAYKEYHDNKKS